MDALQVDQLLYHRAVRSVDPEELHSHGFFRNKQCLKKSTKTGQYGLSLVADARTHRHQFDCLSSCVMYHRSTDGLVNDNITRFVVGTVVDLIVLRKGGGAYQIPVLVCRLRGEYFPLSIIAYVTKKLMCGVEK